MDECVCVCKGGGDIFSVCIPGNCSAALLNNETSADINIYLCLCAPLCECVCVRVRVHVRSMLQSYREGQEGKSQKVEAQEEHRGGEKRMTARFPETRSIMTSC